MSNERSDYADYAGDAAAIARAFDESFAEAPRTIDEDVEALLGAAVEGGTYLLRLHEVKGLASRPKIVPIPTAVAGLLGVMGLRGQVVPVYSLGALLGHPSPIDDATWVFLVEAGSSSVGLGAKEFTGYLRLARREIATAPQPERGGYVRETARVGAALTGVIDVAAVVASLQERVRSSSNRGSGNKER